MRSKILIVDDSASVRNEVRTALEGFNVLEAANGLEGAKLLESRADIALAICDVNMPKMTGIEMLERIKPIVDDGALKVIMLTTEGQPEMVKKARSLGAKGWVVKPFNPQQLLAAAKKLTGLNCA